MSKCIKPIYQYEMHGTYMYRYSEEDLWNGYFTSREDAVADAFENNPDAVWVYVGRFVDNKAQQFVDGQSILELINQRACDYAGGRASDWLYDSIDMPERIAELERLIGDWIQFNEPPQFYGIEDVEFVLRQSEGEV